MSEATHAFIVNDTIHCSWLGCQQHLPIITKAHKLCSLCQTSSYPSQKKGQWILHFASLPATWGRLSINWLTAPGICKTTSSSFTPFHFDLSCSRCLSFAWVTTQPKGLPSNCQCKPVPWLASMPFFLPYHSALLISCLLSISTYSNSHNGCHVQTVFRSVITKVTHSSAIQQNIIINVHQGCSNSGHHESLRN